MTPSERRRRVLRPGTWQLRTRLVAVMAALLTVICVLVGIVSYSALSMTLNAQLNASLQQASLRTIEFYTNAAVGNPDPLNAKATSAGQLSAVLSKDVVHYAGILTADGTRLQLNAADADVLAELLPDGSRADRKLSLGKYRLAAQAAPNGDILITGLPLATTQQTLSTLMRSIMLVSLAGLVALGWAGTVIIRRNLRPLAQLSETASKVAMLRLDAGEVALSARVPDTAAQPGTEVGNVGDAFNAMLENVASALEARQRSETKLRRFVADASHELRTPLTAIRGYTELLSMTEPLSEDGQSSLDRVHEQSVRMSRLIEDLLTLARLDAEQNSGTNRPPEAVAANPVIVDAVRDLQVSHSTHEWTLAVPDEPVQLVCDGGALRQILLNLLSNAAKHTPAGTTVLTSLTPLADGTAALEVSDNGPGIDPEFISIIFDRFSRADAARTGTSGSTGLGLSIVQSLVASQRGKVAVRSVPGNTTFTVLLPMASGSGTPAAPPPPAHKPRIT